MCRTLGVVGFGWMIVMLVVISIFGGVYITVSYQKRCTIIN